MMMINRGDDPGYVKDGLVLWLDGINKGGNDGNWTDLVGGHVFSNGGAMAVADGWDFSGQRMTNSSFAPPNYSVGTIEVCLSQLQTSRQIVFLSTASRLAFTMLESRLALAPARGYTVPIDTALSKSTISGHQERVVINGIEQVLEAYTNYYSPGSANVIGMRINDTLPYHGIIHSIRIYNRRLTKEEMMANQRVDNVRFNLGLTI